ncbi:TIR-NBS type disease resistance protein [Medicago truncatula]|uniref:TIR-NBS type disease resistance protein n=1 Tax=Medicago truncatula TaxID=3880 RepID=A0A072U1L5_MEDTR|nr:TIR-NBS type disease resistance protein [Medicago truncatula]
MDKNESLEVFSWIAFKESSPINGFADLSRDFIEYCKGLPLALQNSLCCALSPSRC